MSTPQRIGGLVFAPSNAGTLFVAQMPLGVSGINFVTMQPYKRRLPTSCQIGIGPIPDRVFFKFSHSAQTGLRNFMAPVLATERCAFTTRLRLTGVNLNSLANRTALS